MYDANIDLLVITSRLSTIVGIRTFLLSLHSTKYALIRHKPLFKLIKDMISNANAMTHTSIRCDRS